MRVATAMGPGVARIRALGYPHYELPLTRSGTGVVSEAAALLSLIGLYRRLRPRIVHHVTIKPVIYGGIAARIARVPAVVSAISGLGYLFSESASSRAGWRMSLVRLLYRLALAHRNSCVILQNHDDRLVLAAQGISSCGNHALIPGSGVDLKGFTVVPEPGGVAVVVMASRLLWQKGVGEFVAAARGLRAAGVKARFLLVGVPDAGNPDSVPVSTLEEWGAEGVIDWMGFRADMADIFGKAHIVVLPSRYREGVPKVLLEAAACGRAIVTTNTPGCRDVVKDGVNGFLVPPGEVATLEARLRTLIEQPELRRRMGELGRLRAESDFCVSTVVRRHLELYAELLSMDAGPRAVDDPA